jgi:hypothetical protein
MNSENKANSAKYLGQLTTGNELGNKVVLNNKMMHVDEI